MSDIRSRVVRRRGWVVPLAEPGPRDQGFGLRLTEQEKLDLVEFLKTL